MYLSSLRTQLPAAMLIAVSLTTSVFAAATVSVTPSGNSSFTVQGTGMDGVAGIQLDIGYDAASLATPTVSQGELVAGAMLAANTSRPGLIKIAIISTRTFSGSGRIATLSFASKTGNGGITSVTTSMIDGAGSPLTSTTSNPSSETVEPGTASTIQTNQTNQTSQTTLINQTNQPAATSTTPTYLGTVTLPGEQQQQADSHPQSSSTVPVNTEETAAARMTEEAQPPGKPAGDSKTGETPQYVAYRGIIDRFKQHNEKKQLAAMAALFDKKIAQTIHQEPALLFSDGNSKATLTVDIPARINSSPNFAVTGGTLVSFKQDKQSKARWIVEVLPEAGTIKVTVTIIAGAEEFEFPLTVAPPVKTSLTLDERGWNRFLKEVGTAGAPLHDFNNDGVRDYMDEFIFVANYLLNKAEPAKQVPAKAPKKK